MDTTLQHHTESMYAPCQGAYLSTRSQVDGSGEGGVEVGLRVEWGEGMRV